MKTAELLLTQRRIGGVMLCPSLPGHRGKSSAMSGRAYAWGAGGAVWAT
jgi:hypothetical protein